jgi:hypothetical protein
LREIRQHGVQVCVFLAANPDEYLTTADVASKFGRQHMGVPSLLRWAIGHGWLVLRPDSRGRSVVSAGPELLKTIGRKP